MTDNIWKRYPVMENFHCLEMKDKLQAKVNEDTRAASPKALLAYFRDSSHRFWQEMAVLRYPHTASKPLVVCEKRVGKFKK